MPFCGTFQKLRPLSLLTHLSSCYDSAHLQVFSNSVSWSVYLDQGKIIYALHSVEPFERLERHLHRLVPQIPKLNSETWVQLRLIFKTASESQSTFSKEEPPGAEGTAACDLEFDSRSVGRATLFASSILPPDYQTICWLVSQKYLNLVQAAILIEGLANEAIESLLLVQSGTYALAAQRDTKPPILCRLELQTLVENCQQRLQGGQSGKPQKTFAHSDTSTVQPQQLVQNIASPNSTTAAGSTATSTDKIVVVPKPHKLSAKSEVFQAPLAAAATQSRRKSRRLPILLLIGIGIVLSLTALIGRLYPYIRLNEIKTLKAEGRYKECIAVGTAVQKTAFSTAAQELLNECLMAYAKQLAAEGKLAEAISAAQKIPATSRMYPEAQKRLREWHEI